MMAQVFVVLLFGFPAVLVSLLLSVVGILKEKFWLVLIGAVLFIPFSYYLSGSPGLYRLPILLPLFQIGSAVAVRAKKKSWAWLLLFPAFFASLWVVVVVLFYQIRS
ncbi:MAG: hypothetical protein HXY35_04130 [Chloroflexi bacterium]|nr:hypothetical protein [Chloroflexota bacterium]